MRTCECGDARRAHARRRQGAGCTLCHCPSFRWYVRTAFLVPFMQAEDFGRLASYHEGRGTAGDAGGKTARPRR